MEQPIFAMGMSHSIAINNAERSLNNGTPTKWSPTQFCSFEKNQKLSETDVCYGGVNEAFIFPFTWGLTSGLDNSSWP